jgi:hypothetical protein
MSCVWIFVFRSMTCALWSTRSGSFAPLFRR